MNSFQLKIFKGYPIIKDGENIILIDTGAPSTINASGSLTFCSENYKCSIGYMGLTV
jgi:hypothetical protein